MHMQAKALLSNGNAESAAITSAARAKSSEINAAADGLVGDMYIYM